LPSDHSDTKYEHCILPGNEPAKYFLRSPFGNYVYDEKIYPGRPGHAEEIFSKIFPGTLAPERAAAPFLFQNVSVRYEYQKGSEGNV